jgi:osmotically-inducible protein OsmY
MKKTIKILNIATCTTLLLTGCVAPIIVGGSAAMGTMATREKGVVGTLSDSKISVTIKKKYYDFSPDLHGHVGINVQEGEVLLTGSVPNEEWQMEAERMAWKVRGVTKVHNNLTVMQDPNSIKETLGSVPLDAWITTQIKSKVLFLENVQSLNYSIKTVDQVVYVMGIAQNRDEAQKVLDVASNTSSVKKVVDYTKMLNEGDDVDSGAAPADQTEDLSTSTKPKRYVLDEPAPAEIAEDDADQGS